MSKVTRIVLVGASGLIGNALLRLAVGRSDIRIVAIARREFPLPPGSRMEALIADPDNWGAVIAATGADVLVCALGTTWKAAGKDEAAFRAVDQRLVLDCVGAAKEAGIRHIIVMSSVGAHHLSRNLYLRVKGEVEQTLGWMKLSRLDVIRPGLLRGKRCEFRLGERIAMLFSPLLDLVLLGPLRKYRSIDDMTIARAIVGLAKETAPGRFTHEHDAILRKARKAGE